jgi:hypothetical protein
MLPATAPLAITDEQREALEKLSGSRTAAHREAQRAQVLLMAGDEGEPNTQIAARVGVSPATVGAWRERFAKEGLKAFAGVRPGRGRKPSITPQKAQRLCARHCGRSPRARRIGAVARWPRLKA